MRELPMAESVPRRIRPTQQLTLFGSSVILGPMQTFAIEQTGSLVCSDSWCGRSHIPHVLARTTEYANASEIAAMSDPAELAGWRVTNSTWNTMYVRDVAIWWTSCGDFYCESCEELHNHNRDDTYACNACGDCDDCCECFSCSYCGERFRDSADICSRCDSCSTDCCDCSSCIECGETISSGNYRCDYCEEECEDLGDESEDCETVATYRQTSPRSGTRTFGVELENIGTHPRRMAAALRANGFSDARFRGYTKGYVREWKSVTDSSVGRGGEVVSPILCGADGFEQLEIATLALLANGSSVDGSCGTHVHIGCEDLTSAEIVDVALFYNRHAEIIDELHAPSRRGRTSWCGPFSDADMERMGIIANDKPKDRYAFSSFPRDRSVNLTALPKYGTIEFRQHAGTLNARKLSAWIRFLFALIEAGKDGAPIASDLPRLLEILRGYGLSESDSDYLLSRSQDLSQRIATASANGRMHSFVEDDA